MLNFANSLTQAYARKLIVGTGLDTRIGFLHDRNEAFVYDLQEVLRPLAEQSVKELLDAHDFERGDFFRLSDYTVMFSERVKRRIIESASRKLSECQVDGLPLDLFMQGWLDRLVKSWGRVSGYASRRPKPAD